MFISRNKNWLVIGLGEKESNRSDFFYSLRGIPFAGWLDKNTVTYNTTAFCEETTAKHLQRIESAAKTRGVQITDSASELFDDFARKLEEINKAKQEAEERETAKKRAICKTQYGCGWCDSLSWIDGKPFCGHTNSYCEIDSVETERLFEEWKLTKVYQRPTPFPVKGCKHLEKLKEQV